CNVQLIRPAGLLSFFHSLSSLFLSRLSLCLPVSFSLPVFLLSFPFPLCIPSLSLFSHLFLSLSLSLFCPPVSLSLLAVLLSLSLLPALSLLTLFLSSLSLSSPSLPAPS